MTLSKETLEPASTAVKTSAPAAAPPSKIADLNRLRADAVSLEVPVKVHGSRVTEVVRGVTPHTEPFEEETSTMIVFPHGGVLRMATVVSVGQMLVLTNQRTSQDAICRVVKVRSYSATQAYVEVEFTHRQAGYWGVHFPADDEDSSGVLDGAPAPEPVQKRAEPPLVSSVTMKVESLPKAPVAMPARNESAFAPIGSQEDVQPSASSTERAAASSMERASAAPIERPKVISIAPPQAQPMRAAAPVAPVAAAPVQHSEPPAPVYMAPPPQPAFVKSVAPEEEAAPEVESHTSRSFGTLTGGAAPVQSSRSSDFGARLDAGTSAQAQPAAPSGGNWMWMAACVFFLVAGLGGGALYFRAHPSAPAQPAVSAADSAALAAVLNQPATVTVSAQDDSARASSPAPAQDVPEAPSHAPSAAVARESRPAASTPAPSVNFSASTARPVARKGLSRSEAAAPSVAPAVAGAAAMPDVLSASNSELPPPPPLQRVRVGGAIKQPQLTRSVPPVYPNAARLAGITGAVVIRAQVDKDGNVGSMKPVSGPEVLQTAAMAALRQWKYSPAALDGTPIATEVTVTIRFQAQ